MKTATITQAHHKNLCSGFYGCCLDVKITSECNGHCAFCIERGGYRPAPAPVDLLIEKTNALYDYQKVLILGGEPFLYPHLAEYVEGIREKQEIYITTNGSLFQNCDLERIARHLTAVNISIHHSDEKVNTQITGAPTNYRQVAEAVKLLHGAGVSVRINTNLINGVHASPFDLLDIIQLVKDMGADSVRFAELQECPELYLGLDNFIAITENPFVDGCEHRCEIDGVQVIFRLTCGLCNSALPVPVNPRRKGSGTKVLYPNGEIHAGWNQFDACGKTAGSGGCDKGCR